MSRNLSKCFHVLKVIASIDNAKARSKALKDLNGDECMFKAIREIALNTLNQNVKLNAKELKKLKRYRPLLGRIANAKGRKSKAQRSKLMVQSGGALTWLIPAVASIFTTLLK